jgi:hypothetical protein
MGSFNKSCGVTGLPLRAGDECYFFPIIAQKDVNFIEGMEIHQGYDFFLPPIKGTYNDYGSIENVDNDFYKEYMTFLNNTFILHNKGNQMDIVLEDFKTIDYMIDDTNEKTLTAELFCESIERASFRWSPLLSTKNNNKRIRCRKEWENEDQEKLSENEEYIAWLNDYVKSFSEIDKQAVGMFLVRADIVNKIEEKYVDSKGRMERFIRSKDHLTSVLPLLAKDTKYIKDFSLIVMLSDFMWCTNRYIIPSMYSNQTTFVKEWNILKEDMDKYLLNGYTSYKEGWAKYPYEGQKPLMSMNEWIEDNNM